MKVTDANERANRGYDDLKSFTCVCCGKPVMLTKFASAKTAKCPDCKASGASINPDFVPTTKPKKAAEVVGATKTLPCVECGELVEVSKFMSAAKVLCDKCKGNHSAGNGMMHGLKIDVSKIDRNKMPTLEDYTVMPSNIRNPRLRSVRCPACGEEPMRVVNILDYSGFGLIIHYQCNHCKLLVNVSEQCNFRCGVQSVGKFYDYTGRAIEDLMNSITSTRIYNTIRQLYDIIKANNIKIEGIELPPYMYEEQKPVPTGYVIPPEDRWVKVIQDTIEYLQYDEGSGDIINRLQQLFKEGSNGNGNEE